MSADVPFEIRHCHTVEEFRQCVEVQEAVWGFDERDLIPVRMFVVARKVEGQIIAGFAPDGKMAGFCLAVPALHGSPGGPTVYLHSHMLAVLPEHRRAGLGQRLKWEQRREALTRGIRLIEWTFDPLEWKNAALNLNRLGAIARRYLPNLYGLSTSPLHRGLPTDRLVAEWWLDSPRVRRCAEARVTPPVRCEERIEIPLDRMASAEQTHSAISEIQARLREGLGQSFRRGLAVLGFDAMATTGSYLLGPWREDS